jgi:hypothetical protein
MQVWINVGDSRAELGYTGITLHIADNSGKKVGRLRVGRANIEWLPGKTSVNSRQMRLETFISGHLDALPKKRSKKGK